MMTIRCALSRLPLLAVAIFLFWGCGGGTGLGPGEIKKREDRLKDRLPVDWNQYNTGDYEEAIGFFTKTLEQADALEGVAGVKNQVKSEAQSGIGWAFLHTQDLEAAAQAFGLATRLDRANTDAWVGWAGVSLALHDYSDVAQYAVQALDTDPDYNSATRIDADGRLLGHDNVDERHVRLMLAEAYFQLGRYSATDRADPNNATAQVRLIDRDFKFLDPGQLLEAISQVSLDLQDDVDAG